MYFSLRWEFEIHKMDIIQKLTNCNKWKLNLENCSKIQKYLENTLFYTYSDNNKSKYFKIKSKINVFENSGIYTIFGIPDYLDYLGHSECYTHYFCLMCTDIFNEQIAFYHGIYHQKTNVCSPHILIDEANHFANVFRNRAITIHNKISGYNIKEIVQYYKK